MTLIIETKKLTKIYGLSGGHQVTAINDVSCSIPKGKWTTIAGPSGSGKSTLLGLMAALDRPTTGEVFVDGHDISFCSDLVQARYRKKKIGIVFQEYNLFEELTSLENVAMPLVVTNMSRKKILERAKRLLDRVGLAGRVEHLPRQLSGGERQRVAIARALVYDPEIIFADEPLSNIDDEAQEEIISIFKELQGRGRSLVVISHDPKVVESSDHIIRLDGGRLAADS